MCINKLIKLFFIMCAIVFYTTTKAAGIKMLPAAVIAATNNRHDDSLQIIYIEKRVNEIRNMDVQNMSAAEKHSLKAELKQLLKQAKGYNERYSSSGVYFSVGALIIIILLLILILR
jgi:hypothetical protein